MGVMSAIRDFVKKNWVSQTKIINRATTDSVKAEDYKIDKQILLDYYFSDPMIKRGVSAIVNKMFSDGYRINAKEEGRFENEVTQATEFIEENNFYSKLKNSARVTLITGDSYQEVADNVYNLNSNEIEIKLNKETGEVDAYVQKINGRIVARIDPERVIHYTIEKIGDNIYGTGLVESIMMTTAIKKFAERNLGERFKKEKLRGFWLFKGLSDTEFDMMTKTIMEAKDNPQVDIYLKGGQNAEVNYSDLIKGDDMQFKEMLLYLRQNQISGLMLHPINMGIPEGSNKASAGEENKDFDEVIASYQTEIENIVTQRLFKDILGLQNITFELISVNKRDTLREMDIATKLLALPVSPNEIREEMGYQKIEEEWADEYNGSRKLSEPVQQETGEEPEEEPEEEKEEEKVKQLKKKRQFEGFPKSSPVTEKDEQDFYKILEGWIVDIETDIIKEMETSPEFKKQIKDPNELVTRVMARNDPAKVRTLLDTQIINVFNKGKVSVETELGRNIALNQESLKFLEAYTFDLVKGVNADISNKLTQVLRRGVVEGAGIPNIRDNIKDSLNISKNRAEAIARTETTRLANTGRVEAYKSAGVTKLKWSAVLDDRTSDICQELDGQIIDLTKGEVFEGEDFQGTSPPAHVNCRSSVIAVVD
jgi:SPP1 gp7 family putative phage head morphogenesis protein